MKHIERLGGGVRQIDSLFQIHFFQIRPPILDHDADTMPTQADVQQRAKRQGPVRGNEIVFFVDLAGHETVSPLQVSGTADPIGRDHKYSGGRVHISEIGGPIPTCAT